MCLECGCGQMNGNTRLQFNVAGYTEDSAKEVEKTNKNDFLKSLGIKIKDTKAGQKIDKGATAETLRDRFTKA